MSFLDDMPAICAACGDDHYYHECGQFVDPTIIHEALGEPIRGGGFVPQQFEGNTIDGRYFYFRNRHGIASLTVSIAPMNSEEFWDEMYFTAHDQDCDVRGTTSLGPCILAGRSCDVELSPGYRYAEISDRGDPDVAYGGWAFDAEGQRLRNLVFAKLWEMTQSVTASEGEAHG